MVKVSGVPGIPPKSLIGNPNPVVLADLTFKDPTDLTKLTVHEISGGGTAPTIDFFYDANYRAACMRVRSGKSGQVTGRYGAEPTPAMAIGFELEFATSKAFGGIWVGLVYSDGTNKNCGSYDFKAEPTGIQIQRSDNNYYKVGTMPALAEQEPYIATGMYKFPPHLPFYRLKFMIDFRTKYYIGCQILDTIIDSRTEGLYIYGSGYEPNSLDAFLMFGGLRQIWLRRWKVTAGEKW